MRVASASGLQSGTRIARQASWLKVRQNEMVQITLFGAAWVGQKMKRRLYQRHRSSSGQSASRSQAI